MIDPATLLDTKILIAAGKVDALYLLDLWSWSGTSERIGEQALAEG